MSRTMARRIASRGLATLATRKATFAMPVAQKMVAAPRRFMSSQETVTKIEDVFGDNVFNSRAQRKYLSPGVFKTITNCVNTHQEVDEATCEHFAAGMLRWAEDRGATHFTHWFIPLTGKSASKHDSFIRKSGDHVINAFSGKILSRGEPDASSFPNGGYRATHQARGYTVWDPSSPCFIIDHGSGSTLYVPTVFLSWKGRSLDEKCSVLRSIAAINKSALSLLAAAGDDSHKFVHSESGLEQEFFLVDSEFYLARPDLVQTGRTLLGRAPPKGQNLDDHYFGDLNERALHVINDFEREAWKLGIPQTTRHKEVAPGQYEIAPVFGSAVTACDQNVLVMDCLQRAARKHGMECLLHEKPFAGVNGSGKHNNWSIGSDKIGTFLDPGPIPQNNLVFMLFLTATLRAVNLNGDLLRTAIASVSNDFRLGANEAPPAIVSAYLGQEIFEVCNRFIAGNDEKYVVDLRLGDASFSCLPRVERDPTDRNRTSPFAFTGNKFEFRAVGSSQMPHRSTYLLNAIVSDSCNFLAEQINAKTGGVGTKEEKEAAAKEVLRVVLAESMNVVYEGDCYSEEWHVEAAKRGLPNNKTTPEAIKSFTAQKNIDLLSNQEIMSKDGIQMRANVWNEQYIVLRENEARATVSLINTLVLPAAVNLQNDLSSSITSAKDAGVTCGAAQVGRLARVTELIDHLIAATDKITVLAGEVHLVSEDLNEQAHFSMQNVLPAMDAARAHSDELEGLVDAGKWPLPTYHEMLYQGQSSDPN